VALAEAASRQADDEGLAIPILNHLPEELATDSRSYYRHDRPRYARRSWRSKMLTTVRAFSVVAVAVAAVASAADRPVGRDFADRSVVYARHGMVVTAHPLATEVGLEVLREGS